MQRVDEDVQITDPPLAPKEPTPSQRLFRAFMTSGQTALEAEYRRIYPASSSPEPKNPPLPAMPGDRG